MTMTDQETNEMINKRNGYKQASNIHYRQWNFLEYLTQKKDMHKHDFTFIDEIVHVHW